MPKNLSSKFSTSTAALLTLLLAACGGSQSLTDQVPDGYQRVNGRLLPLCTPQTSVRIQLFGDSTQELQGTEVQQWLDGRFGTGVVTVDNYGKSGSTSLDFSAALVKPGAITLVNYGINDSWLPDANADAYKKRMAAVAPSIFQTPNPSYDG